MLFIFCCLQIFKIIWEYLLPNILQLNLFASIVFEIKGFNFLPNVANVKGIFYIKKYFINRDLNRWHECILKHELSVHCICFCLLVFLSVCVKSSQQILSIYWYKVCVQIGLPKWQLTLEVVTDNISIVLIENFSEIS